MYEEEEEEEKDELPLLEEVVTVSSNNSININNINMNNNINNNINNNHQVPSTSPLTSPLTSPFIPSIPTIATDSSTPRQNQVVSVTQRNVFLHSSLLQPLFRLLDVYPSTVYSPDAYYSIEDSIIQEVANQSMESYWSELNPRDPTKRIRYCLLESHTCGNSGNCHHEDHFDSVKHRVEKCFVCLELFIDNEMVLVISPCRHVFHLDCIQQAIQFQSKCPLCRQEILLETF